MKLFIAVLLILFTVSCTLVASSNNVNSNEGRKKKTAQEQTGLANLTYLANLSEAIKLVKQNKDYRLLVTSGRSMSVPGVKASKVQAIIKLCGKKYYSATGDVLTSEKQRLARKKVVGFMRQYNEQMLVICQEKLTNLR